MPAIKRVIPGLLLILTVSCGPFSRGRVTIKEAKDSNGYRYSHVIGDDLGVRTYVLENGLTVNISVNRDEPRIQTYIAVKAGSKYDPPETTGLAHYLEHMMFKGTSRLGTSDWEAEKPLLDEIAELYEQHRKSDDPDEKKRIYSKIDEVSSRAAAFAVPNEYDKLTTSIGARGTNAHTWVEETVYHNDIPSNELRRWLLLERERFGELVLRLFHTELEAVYEEFNMFQDNDQRRLFTELMSLLFPTHPYGQQTTIGEADHLKNPSMYNIIDYWSTWYVPNNMSINLVGDLDPDKSIKLIDEIWGDLEPNNSLPVVEFTPEKPITEPVSKTIYGPSSDRLALAFRFPAEERRSELLITIIDMLLNNRQAGLIDLNLIHDQKVLEAFSHPEFYADYSLIYMGGTPLAGQTLDEVRDLLLDQIDHIKKGEFEDWLVDAVINDLSLHQMKQMETNRGRAYEMVKSFILDRDWASQVSFISELETISRQEIIDFARTHFSDNYVTVYKRQGQEESLVKVEKPQITPIEINRERQSQYFKDFMTIEPEEVTPVFIDYDREIESNMIRNGVNLYSIENSTNQRASLSWVWEMGREHDRRLELALEYLDYLGTPEMSAVELKEELYRLGLSIEHDVDDRRFKLTIKGLDKSLEEGIALLDTLLNTAVVNDDAYRDLVSQVIEKRRNRKSDKRQILDWAMVSYAKYGESSPYTNILSSDELKSLNPGELVDLIHSFTSLPHEIHYYGTRPGSTLQKILVDFQSSGKSGVSIPEVTIFPEIDHEENLVYFVHHDMIQADMLLVSKDSRYSPDLMASGRIFNEFYGSGLSSVIFQEIRESRALAYSAYSFYSVPTRNDRSHYIYGYIGTQADKLSQASAAMLDLLTDMPEADSQFEVARDAMLNKIANERITKEKVFSNWLTDRDRGLDYDSRKKIYEDASEYSLEDLESFFAEHIASDQWTVLILGDRKLVDLETMSRYGRVQELTLEQIFGYGD
jgi:zinc protease